ncbi:hypothetical protein M885DRAFT_509202 [Pelagophyceae sp. CCMP2097]|nr:hypothetical protein M885DRAFT_509202 [Pelagophyceae sp. CCMP2097]
MAQVKGRKGSGGQKRLSSDKGASASVGKSKKKAAPSAGRPLYAACAIACAAALGAAAQGHAGARARGAAANALASVQRGECSSSDALPVLPAASVADLFASGDTVLQCPFVVRGAVGASEVWRKDVWATARAHGSAKIDYDSLQDRLGKRSDDEIVIFHYWDNSTVLRPWLKRQRQTHLRVSATGAAFVSAAARGDAVRFGGSLRKFSAQLDRLAVDRFLALVPKEPSSSMRAIGLWAGAAGTESAPHYDSFHNFHIILAGTKDVALAAPADVDRFLPHSAAHPGARQAQRDAFRDDAFGGGGAALPARATLQAGDAVFVPAGWVHRFSVGAQPAMALSLTALPREYGRFDAWVRRGSSATLPHLAQPGPWPRARLVATLDVFVQELVRLLKPPEKNATFARDVLLGVVESYGFEERRDLGLTQRADARFKCRRANAFDLDLAQAAARQVAAVFTNEFRPALRLLYLRPYLENVLTTAAQSRSNRTLVGAFDAALNFVEVCLLADHGNGPRVRRAEK